MQSNVKIDKAAYALARGYLPDLKIEGVTDALVKRYLSPESLKPRPMTRRGLYLRVLQSAQNAGMKAGVIGGSIGGVEKLGPVLENFSAEAVLHKYGDDWQKILNDIVRRLKPRGQIRMTDRSIWPHYCQTVLSAASFIKQFSSAKEFYSWADFFDSDDRARPSLPMLLSKEIKGFGFALACDFLKELGYTGFPKPDVHLRDIFTGLGLFKDGEDDFQLLKAIVRVARNANVTPYTADKTFWLIGSGYFYNHPHIGKKGRIGNHKKEFIKYAKYELRKIK
jgi:hypothetical protein